MKYSIHIDQVHAIEWKLNLSEATCFSFCYALPSWAETVVIDGEVYYFASRTKVIKELPILTDKVDTVYRLYKAIDEKGLIRYRRFNGKDCIQITAKGKEWNSEKNPSKEMNSENFPSDNGKFSELGVENFPTYNNTSIDNNTIDTTSLSKKEIAPEIEFEPTAKNASGSEGRYMAAMEKITLHLKNYPDTLELIRGEARRNYDNREMMERIQDWVRYYCDDVMFSTTAEHRLRFGNKSFVWWLKQRPAETTKKPVNNGTNRNNQTAEERERQRAAGAFAVRDQILREHGIDPSQYGGDY